LRGARAIVRAYKRATDSGAEVRLVVTAALVWRIFGLMGVDRLLDIYPSVAAAHAPDGTDSRAESAGPNPRYPAAARNYRPTTPSVP
jgi:hypothetical protein